MQSSSNSVLRNPLLLLPPPPPSPQALCKKLVVILHDGQQRPAVPLLVHVAQEATELVHVPVCGWGLYLNEGYLNEGYLQASTVHAAHTSLGFSLNLVKRTLCLHCPYSPKSLLTDLCVLIVKRWQLVWVDIRITPHTLVVLDKVELVHRVLRLQRKALDLRMLVDALQCKPVGVGCMHVAV